PLRRPSGGDHLDVLRVEEHPPGFGLDTDAEHAVPARPDVACPEANALDAAGHLAATDDAEPLAASGPGRFFGGPASLLLRRLRVEPGAVLCHGLRRGIDLGGVEVGPATRGPPWRRTC